MMICDQGELLDALDNIPYPPFEMAVKDNHGRVAIVYADEDATLGILRLPYEDEECAVALVREDHFPMVVLSPQPSDP